MDVKYHVYLLTVWPHFLAPWVVRLYFTSYFTPSPTLNLPYCKRHELIPDGELEIPSILLLRLLTAIIYSFLEFGAHRVLFHDT